MPVDPSVYAAFVLASAVLLVIPGPTVVMVIGQALSHGRAVALSSVAGVGLGDLLAASLSLAGVGALLSASAAAFVVLKWLGAAYLVWMGIALWRSPARLDTPGEAPADEPGGGARAPGRKVFRDAFLVTLLNPKGIVFFVAFVPQFLDPVRPYLPQATLFVGTFVFLGIVNAAAYAAFAGAARDVIRRTRVVAAVSRLGAACLCGAGILTVLARRPA